MNLFQKLHQTNHFRCLPILETLEVRSCPSALLYDIIAETGDLGMTGMGDNPSINDAGRVAFVGQFSDGQGLVVGDGTTQGLRNINPVFSHTSTRMFGRGAAINDQDQVLATDQVSGNPPQYLLRTWDANGTDAFTLLARAGLNNDPYNAILYAPAFNNTGSVVFPALRGSSVLLVTQNPPGMQTFSSPQAMRPQMDDSGDVVVRAGNQDTSPILLYGPGLTAPVNIASTDQGFSQMGSSPGITHDGQVITFYATLTADGARNLNAQNQGVIPYQLTAGPGIFASIAIGGTRYIAPVAATSQSEIGVFKNISAFDPTARVAVATYGSGDEATVVYVATYKGHQAILSGSVELFGATAGIGGPTVIAEVGRVIGGLSVSNLNIYDAVNNQGQIAFWERDAAGNAAIIRATPSRVTAAQLQAIMPGVNATLYVDPLNRAMAEFGIDTPLRQAAFLANLAEETNRLKKWDEKASLSKPVGTHLDNGGTVTVSDECHYVVTHTNGQGTVKNKPVYVSGPNFICYEPDGPAPNRAQKLGNNTSGDGSLFHGRGPIQLTGRKNYTKVGKQLGLDITSDSAHAMVVADSAHHPDVGFRAAAEFWRMKHLSAIADIVDPTDPTSIKTVNEKITEKVNGAGLGGLEVRYRYYVTALHVLLAGSGLATAETRVPDAAVTEAFLLAPETARQAVSIATPAEASGFNFSPTSQPVAGPRLQDQAAGLPVQTVESQSQPRGAAPAQSDVESPDLLDPIWAGFAFSQEGLDH